MGSPGLLVEGLVSPALRPCPGLFLAAPATGASSGSGSAAIYGARMGRRGAAAPAPPPAQTDWEGEEGRGRDTGWEGATELGEEGGLGAGPKQDPHRHSDTHLLHITPTPGITETHTHCSGTCTHTHIHKEEGWQHTHPRLTGSHIS